MKMPRAIGLTCLLVVGCGEIREVPVADATSTGTEATDTLGTASDGSTGHVDRDTETSTPPPADSSTGDTPDGDRVTVCGRGDDTIEGVVELVLEVEEGGTIADLDLLLRVYHQAPQDLEVRLQRDGTERWLVRQSSATSCGADLLVVFDDEAATPASMRCDADEPPRLAPIDPLAVFDGHPLAGTWTLRVIDNGDVTGHVETWCLSTETAG
jgi:hypothetical protein